MLYLILHPDIEIDLFAILNLFGIVQGLMLAYLFTNKTHRHIPSNSYLGLLILFMAITNFDSFLGYTNYMFNMIRLNDFSEPLTLLIGPFFYFFTYSKLNYKKSKKSVWHYLPAILYFLYMIPYHIADSSVKYNAYINAYHPDLTFQEVPVGEDFNDILGLHNLINEMIAISLLFYGILSFIALFRYKKKNSINQKNFQFIKINLVIYAFLFIVFIFIKAIFKSDLGDHFMDAIAAIIIYSISFHLIKQSVFFKDDTGKKYKKSSLSDDLKKRILHKINYEMDMNQFYLRPDANLPDLSKLVDSNSNHVSQVINELLHMNYFELVAMHRINYAKKILLDEKMRLITIEELANLVGYSSKSAFNKSFKKVTQQTPTEYRDSIQ